MAFPLLAAVLFCFVSGTHVGDDEQVLSELSEASLAVLREIMELSAEDKQWLSDQFYAAPHPVRWTSDTPGQLGFQPDPSLDSETATARFQSLDSQLGEVDDSWTTPTGVQPYNPSTSGIEAFMIDLDGTTYEPEGIIEGAKEFYQWMDEEKKKYVFLSNTGAKTGSGTQKKLGGDAFLGTLLDKDKYIWTAAEAQIDMMAEKIPEDARLFVLSGFAHTDEVEPEWLKLLRKKVPKKVDSWTVKTAISLKEAQEWGAGTEQPTFVVMFVDGRLVETDPLPAGGINPTNLNSNEPNPTYHDDWSFELFTKVSAILGPGHAKLVYTADDAFNPDHVDRCKECKESGTVDVRKHTFPLPGPGMFAASLRKLMYPYRELGDDNPEVLVSGKGGNMGSDYMYKKAFEMLEGQGQTLKFMADLKEEDVKQPGMNSNMAMIGDRFDTDIIGGLGAGVNAILVESGAHKNTDFFYYLDPYAIHGDSGREEDRHPLERTTYANCVAELIPDAWKVKNKKESLTCKHA